MHPAVGLQLHIVDVRRPEEFEAAFSATTRERVSLAA
jgi:hypothetical protein